MMLVRQYHLGKYRSTPEFEIRGFLVEVVQTDDIGRHQVRRELYPTERTTQRARDRFGERRFATPRHIFQEDMPVAKERGQRKLNHRGLPDYHSLDTLAQPFARAYYGSSFHVAVVPFGRKAPASLRGWVLTGKQTRTERTKHIGDSYRRARYDVGGSVLTRSSE